MLQLCQIPRVNFAKDWLEGVNVTAGEVTIVENVRFNIGEGKDDEALSKKMAALCDIYVMDAFGTAHRTQASTHGVAKFAPVACAGPLLVTELEALGKALNNPARPMIAIVGGSKVSTKLTILESLSQVVDQLIVGGGIANTFIAAKGYNVGKSLFEADLIDEAKRLSIAAEARGNAIPMPSDIITATVFAEDAEASLRHVADAGVEDMIFDIGPETQTSWTKILKNAGTIIWNGPVGLFEFDQFGSGTKAIAKAIAESNAFTIAGGGDTLAAINKYDVGTKISYISTGGGAFLAFLEGKPLPAVIALEQRANN